MVESLFFNNYTPSVDIAVIIICIVYTVLLYGTYADVKNGANIFVQCTLLLILAALSHVSLNLLLIDESSDTTIIRYLLNFIYSFSMLLSLVALLKYLTTISKIPENTYSRLMCVNVVILTLTFLVKILQISLVCCFHVNNALSTLVYMLANAIVWVAYIVFYVEIILTVFCFRAVFLPYIYYSTLLCFVVSLFLTMVSVVNNQSSYLCFTLLIPVIVTLHNFHVNPYNVSTGTLEPYWLQKILRHIDTSAVYLISVTIKDITEDDLRRTSVYKTKGLSNFWNKYFVLKLKYNRLLIVCDKKRDSNYSTKIHEIISNLNNPNGDTVYQYKVVVTDIIEQLKDSNDYNEFFDFVEQSMAFCSYKLCDKSLSSSYLNRLCVKECLLSIAHDNNLQDDRILVYCQPILNTATNTFRTAESLMRLRVGDSVILPDVFIPIAEDLNIIHNLTLIMLNKVCEFASTLIDDGYDFDRISVNVAVSEVCQRTFANDVVQSIRRHDIPYEKIAIEITESLSYDNFSTMLCTLLRLRKIGVSFYLDDFGTGYSNLSRILSVPFDVIKFDKSLTSSAKSNDKNSFMMSSLANLFKKAGYTVLFEGIEDKKTEDACIDMQADYLQGYRYSKPTPIVNLHDFFTLRKEV